MVDDDEAVRTSLRRSLEFEGYQVRCAADGALALAAIAQRRPDLVLLDLQLPHMDGLTTCRRLRAAGEDVPVLMLTARDGTTDRVSGLDAGADDYLAKPFALEELLARLRAIFRRQRSPEAPDLLGYAGLTMDLLTREVHREGQPLELTRTEWSLLEVFLQQPRAVLTREFLLATVWGYDFDPGSNTLDVYIGYLRKKTEQHGPRLLQTVRGVGFSLRSLHQ